MENCENICLSRSIPLCSYKDYKISNKEFINLEILLLLEWGVNLIEIERLLKMIEEA